MRVVTLARKPLAGSVTESVMEQGVGGLNIGATRLETEDGKPHYVRLKGAKGWGFHGGVGDRSPDGTRQDPVVLDLGRWPNNVILVQVSVPGVTGRYFKRVSR